MCTQKTNPKSDSFNANSIIFYPDLNTVVLEVFLLVLGFALVIKGADWFVEAASAVARKYHISDLAIGLTVVAFGTSAPELAVSLFAAIQGHQEIVFGNMIGSNNFNLFIILGITGLIIPLTVQSSTVWKEIPVSLLGAALLLFMANDFWGKVNPTLSRWDGAFLLVGFGAFMFYVYKQLNAEPQEPDITAKKRSTAWIWFFGIIGLLMLVGGGKIVVDKATAIAHRFDVSEALIGLTIVAAGTSLPELATSVMAAIKKKADIAVGNIIGSNIFNIFLILGISSVIKPIGYNPALNTDIFILMGGSALLFIFMFSGKKRKLDRLEAAILLLIFIGYSIFLVVREVGSLT